MTLMHPSVVHRLMVEYLRLTRAEQAGSPERLDEYIRDRDLHPERTVPSRKSLRGHARAARKMFRDWTVWTLAPSVEPTTSAGTIIAIHGGGYYGDTGPMCFSAYADLVARTGATVLVPQYPLIPHATAGEVVPAMADFLADRLVDDDPGTLSVIGDSAGAGLAMAAIQELVRRGDPVPAHLVMLSPWLDVTLTDPRCRMIRDPLLNADGLIAAGRLWAGDLDSDDPRVSPLYGPLDGLPDASVYSGTLDRLHPDSVRLRERVESIGAPIHFHFDTGVCHAGYVLPWLPDYKEVADDIVRDLGMSPRRVHSG